MKRGAVCCGLLFILLSYGYAGQRTEADTSGKPFMLYFRFDKAVVDNGYMDNSRTLHHMAEILTDCRLCGRIDSINILSFASPDGDRSYNERLTHRRSAAVKGYLVWKYPYLDQYRIHSRPQGENWQELRRLIAADEHLPNREEVLQILDRHKDTERCKTLLKKLNGGIPYSYIHNRMLRYLRNAAICMVWIRPDSMPALPCATYLTPDSMPADKAAKLFRQQQLHESESAGGYKTENECSTPYTQETLYPQKAPYTQQTSYLQQTPYLQKTTYHQQTSRPQKTQKAPETSFRRRPLFALKTNVLFDAALMPNIEIEVPIGKRWSVNGEYMFPWWLLKSDRYCLEILSGGLEGRYWLGSTRSREHREALTGHFVGLYAGGGEYDLQWKENGYQGEFFIAAGLSYGWATRIARNLHLEFNIGIGLLRTNYRHYHAQDNYRTLMWQENGNYTWFGPTKAKISLVWLLNRKVKKGGAE